MWEACISFTDSLRIVMKQSRGVHFKKEKCQTTDFEAENSEKKGNRKEMDSTGGGEEPRGQKGKNQSVFNDA